MQLFSFWKILYENFKDIKIKSIKIYNERGQNFVNKVFPTFFLLKYWLKIELMTNFEQKYDIEKLILKSKLIQALIDILPNFI